MASGDGLKCPQCGGPVWLPDYTDLVECPIVVPSEHFARCQAPSVPECLALAKVSERCGAAHELGKEGLSVFSPWTAAVTTELAIAGPTQYLAFWRVEAALTVRPNSAWERLRQLTAPQTPYLYVPAFSLRRPLVQVLGVRLTETQPLLYLNEGLRPAATGGRLDLASQSAAGVVEGGEVAGSSDLGCRSFLPVVVGREEARVLSYFVYLAYEAHESRELYSVECGLTADREDLVFVPAVWDPRQIHEANWRLLLREFDDLVA